MISRLSVILLCGSAAIAAELQPVAQSRSVLASAAAYNVPPPPCMNEDSASATDFGLFDETESRWRQVRQSGEREEEEKTVAHEAGRNALAIHELKLELLGFRRQVTKANGLDRGEQSAHLIANCNEALNVAIYDGVVHRNEPRAALAQQRQLLASRDQCAG